MINLSIQILPIEDDSVFEQMVCDIFNSIEKTTSFDLFGRSGQKQSGIDIYSLEKKTAIQCKHKLINRTDFEIRKELIKDLNFELDQFINYNNSTGTPYKKFVFATTFKNDIVLIEECNILSIKYKIEVEYWHWKRLIKNLDSSIVEIYYSDLFKENFNYYNEKSLNAFKIDIDKNLSITEQMALYFNVLFKEIKVLNSGLFLNQYPFKTDINYTYRTSFTLDSDCENLTTFFDSFDINNGVVEMKNQNEDEKSKVEYILRTLLTNNIFSFRNNKTNFIKTFEINNYKEDSYFEIYDQFKFVEGLNLTPNLLDIDSLEDFMKLGYFYYRIGNLIESIEVFKKTKVKASSENKNITVLICNHNLYHLGRLVNFRYWNPNHKEITNELTTINLNEIYSDFLHIEFYSYIINKNFINESRIKIRSLTNKVIENYQSFLRGGMSSSNYEWDIIYEYSILSSFLNMNNIIYDCYTEYKEVVLTFLESLLASYAIKNGQDRISYLDDFYLNHIVDYLETDEIEKLFKRYEIYTIDYKDNYNSEYNFIQLFENLVNSKGVDLKEIFTNSGNVSNGYSNHFWRNRKRLFMNFIYLSGKINLEAKDIKKISKLIIKYIEDSDGLEIRNFDYIINFLIQKRAIISNEDLKFFINHFIKNQEHYSSFMFTTFCNILKKDNLSVKFSKLEFNSIFTDLVYYNKESELIYSMGIDLYGIVNNEFKGIIKKCLLGFLDSNFEFYLYYNCVIYEIVEYNYKNYFQICIDNFDLNNLNPIHNNPFFSEENKIIRYGKIDEILNVCFKFDIDIKEERFNAFKGISEYYDWILDIDNYNYKDFNPYWLNEYSTSFYDNYFRRHKKLKEEVEKIINIKEDNRLTKIFHRVFC